MGWLKKKLVLSANSILNTRDNGGGNTRATGGVNGKRRLLWNMLPNQPSFGGSAQASLAPYDPLLLEISKPPRRFPLVQPRIVGQGAKGSPTSLACVP